MDSDRFFPFCLELGEEREREESGVAFSLITLNPECAFTTLQLAVKKTSDFDRWGQFAYLHNYCNHMFLTRALAFFEWSFWSRKCLSTPFKGFNASGCVCRRRTKAILTHDTVDRCLSSHSERGRDQTGVQLLPGPRGAGERQTDRL